MTNGVLMSKGINSFVERKIKKEMGGKMKIYKLYILILLPFVMGFLGNPAVAVTSPSIIGTITGFY